MNNKIDHTIFEKINVLELNKNYFDCVVYSNNYLQCKNELERTINSKFKLEEFPFIKAFGAKLSFLQISKLANFNHVNYITSSLKVQTQINVSKNIIELKNVNVPHNFCTVVIDTGVGQILDLCVPNNKIVKFVDFVNNKKVPYDDNGHGTSVAGLLVGSGVVSDNKYAGIDTNTDILIIKALDKNGETNAINILKAMQWVYNNKDKYNIRIACMSFGSNVLEINDPLIAGAEALWDNGIVVVSACGNSGPESETIKSPSASKKIISVGALDDHRNNDTYSIANFEIAEFSSRGPILGNFKPDVVVSGVDVVSSCNYGIYKTFYRSMSGTSVATPIVAGIVSRVLKKNPTFTPDQVKQFLIAHTRRITNDRNSEGYGWIDLHDVNL